MHATVFFTVYFAVAVHIRHTVADSQSLCKPDATLPYILIYLCLLLHIFLTQDYFHCHCPTTTTHHLIYVPVLIKYTLVHFLFLSEIHQCYLSSLGLDRFSLFFESPMSFQKSNVPFTVTALTVTDSTRCRLSAPSSVPDTLYHP